MSLAWAWKLSTSFRSFWGKKYSPTGRTRKRLQDVQLGWFLEIIAFYLLESWGFSKNISTEEGLPEFGNEEITHNVEYALHPVGSGYQLTIGGGLRNMASSSRFFGFAFVSSERRKCPEARAISSTAAIERALVRFRRLIEAADFPYELQRSSANLLVSHGRIEIEERPDVSAHSQHLGAP